MLPFKVATMAMFDVTAPSSEFKVDTRGCVSPSGHRLRYPKG